MPRRYGRVTRGPQPGANALIQQQKCHFFTPRLTVLVKGQALIYRALGDRPTESGFLSPGNVEVICLRLPGGPAAAVGDTGVSCALGEHAGSSWEGTMLQHSHLTAVKRYRSIASSWPRAIAPAKR